MQRPYPYRHTITHAGRATPCPTSAPIAIRDCASGRRYDLPATPQELTLGGSSDCDIVLSDPFASASHCSLRRIGERWLLKDHDSKNGTRINGTRIRLAELRSGSHILIGNTRLEIVSSDDGARSRSGLIGNAANFLLAVEKAHRAGRSRCPVLILGETGTGKELIARTIHDASRRSEQPFVTVNCGGIAANLIRSELFGHTKGSFTGATAQHDGVFTQAHGGTIFLDELGELPLDQQPHLLRALETGLIRRVGAQHEELVNTRFVSATNRDCLDTRSSPLRSDLFHRLSTVIIELPPLRERISDVPILVQHFLSLGIDEYGPREVAHGVMEELSRHQWSGNIRELRNSVARALALGSQRLRLQDFLPKGVVPYDRPDGREVLSEANREDLSSFEVHQSKLLQSAYQEYGTIRRAAQELGIPKSTFADMCTRYGIDTRRRRRVKP